MLKHQPLRYTWYDQKSSSPLLCHFIGVDVFYFSTLIVHLSMLNIIKKNSFSQLARRMKINLVFPLIYRTNGRRFYSSKIRGFGVQTTSFRSFYANYILADDLIFFYKVATARLRSRSTAQSLKGNWLMKSSCVCVTSQYRLYMREMAIRR